MRSARCEKYMCPACPLSSNSSSGSPTSSAHASKVGEDGTCRCDGEVKKRCRLDSQDWEEDDCCPTTAMKGWGEAAAATRARSLPEGCCCCPPRAATCSTLLREWGRGRAVAAPHVVDVENAKGEAIVGK